MTAVPALDRLAVDSGSFAQKMAAIRTLGFDVVEDLESRSRGEFDFDSLTFTYNPETMTRLDLAHEWRHYKQLVRLQKRGTSFRSRGASAAEVGAYRFEERLWQRLRLTPSAEYRRFHASNLSQYLAEVDSRRVQDFLKYHPIHAEVFRS